MSETTITELALRLLEGELVPYLGPGTLNGVRHRTTGAEIPADSDSLILAMHNGRPVAPRLMYEFPRAAMDMELKRGRNAVTRFLTDTYGQSDWTRSPMHAWLASIRTPYIVDINRDTQLQEVWAETPHTRGRPGYRRGRRSGRGVPGEAHRGTGTQRRSRHL